MLVNVWSTQLRTGLAAVALLAWLIGMGTARSGLAQTSPCIRFEANLLVAQAAYEQYAAYPVHHPLKDAAEDAFVHDLTVAEQTQGGCTERTLRRGLYALELRREFTRFIRFSPTVEDRRRSVKRQQQLLDALYETGFATSDPGTYAVFKSWLIENGRATGDAVRSPETGKVLVAKNNAVSNCKRNDRPVPELLAPIVLETPPEVRRDRSYRHALSVELGVGEDGKVGMSVVIPLTWPGTDQPDYAQHDAAIRAADEAIRKAFRPVPTFRPAIVECAPTAMSVYFRIDIANGTMVLTGPTAQEPSR